MTFNHILLLILLSIFLFFYFSGKSSHDRNHSAVIAGDSSDKGRLVRQETYQTFVDLSTGKVTRVEESPYNGIQFQHEGNLFVLPGGIVIPNVPKNTSGKIVN